MTLDIEITSKNDNKLLDRQEINVRVGFSAQTPNRKEIREGIGGKLAADPANVVLREVVNEFGQKQIRVLAHVYNDVEKLKKNEPYYILVRDGLAQKKEKKKKEKKAAIKKKEPK